MKRLEDMKFSELKFTAWHLVPTWLPWSACKVGQHACSTLKL